MKNITVTVDDETYRSARIRAAELGHVGVRDGPRVPPITFRKTDGGSALPKPLVQRRDRLLREVVQDFDARGTALRAADHLSREELFDRAAAQIDAEAKRRSGRNRGRRP